MLLMNTLNIVKMISIGIFLFCSGCYGDVMSKNEIEKVIHENLKQGSSEKEIITFFEVQGWNYGFNRHFGRFLASNPEENDLLGIYGRNQIYIYVDDQRRFVRVEVEKVFNSL